MAEILDANDLAALRTVVYGPLLRGSRVIWDSTGQDAWLMIDRQLILSIDITNQISSMTRNTMLDGIECLSC